MGVGRGGVQTDQRERDKKPKAIITDRSVVTVPQFSNTVHYPTASHMPFVIHSLSITLLGKFQHQVVVPRSPHRCYI